MWLWDCLVERTNLLQRASRRENNVRYPDLYSWGDSEGTLGGLVRQGYSDVFPSIFHKAIQSARLCSNDPVCSLSRGQGRDSLNLAACYSCVLLPENSCEDFNVFLDRGTVIGTMKQQNLGFYSSNTRVAGSVVSVRDVVERKTGVNNHAKMTIILTEDTGSSKEGMSWDEIWDDFEGMVETEQAVNVVNQLRNSSQFFSGREYPLELASFSTSDDVTHKYTAQYLWPKSKVILFSEKGQTTYEAVKNSDWKCFSITAGITPEEIANSLEDI